MSRSSRHALLSIQLARAIAALSVAWVHLDRVSNGIAGRATASPLLHRCALAGVDLFFVISGFIIAHVTAGQPFEPSFFKKRFLRIVPFYWFFTIIFVVASAASKHGDVQPDVVARSLSLMPQSNFPTLIVGWSLEHETIFYAIAGCALWAGQSIVATMAAASICSVAVHVAYPAITGNNIWDYHLFSLYQIEFLAGVVLYRFRHLAARLDYRVLFTFAAAMLLLTAKLVESTILPGIATQTTNTGLLGLLRVVGFAAASLLILAALLSAERRGMLASAGRGVRLTAVIGNASYAIYLSHTLVLSALGKLCGRIDVPLSMRHPVLALCFIIAIAFGVCWFFLVEAPLLKRWRH